MIIGSKYGLSAFLTTNNQNRYLPWKDKQTKPNKEHQLISKRDLIEDWINEMINSNDLQMPVSGPSDDGTVCVCVSPELAQGMLPLRGV